MSKESSNLQKFQQEFFHDLGTARRTSVSLSYLMQKYRSEIQMVDGRNLEDSIEKAIRFRYEEVKGQILANRKRVEEKELEI